MFWIWGLGFGDYRGSVGDYKDIERYMTSRV